MTSTASRPGGRTLREVEVARQDSKACVPVFLDNCVWDFLFGQKIDLAQELPARAFRLFIVREIEFGIEPIEKDKPELARFIRQTIASACVCTWRAFGFFDERHSAKDQRVGPADLFRAPASTRVRTVRPRRTVLPRKT
jgi:hypothetical protein